jgi:hypothetical protein
VCRGDKGGSVILLSTSLHQRTLVWGRSPPPTFSLPVRWHTDLSLSPSPRPCFLTRDVFRLPPRGILWRSGLLWLIIASPRSCAKLRAPLKDRIMKATKTGPSLLTLALTIPFRKGDMADSGVQDDPEVQDLMDPGINLCCAQFLGGGAVGAAQSRIHPHLDPLPPERLDPVAKNVHRRCTPVSPSYRSC